MISFSGLAVSSFFFKQIWILETHICWRKFQMGGQYG